MLKHALTFVFITACAVDPVTLGVQQERICALDEDGNWIGDCGSVPGGGGGGGGGDGGGGDGSCHTTPCESDLSCQFMCWNPQARCVRMVAGPYQWAGCADN
jgi:hypothetical protein